MAQLVNSACRICGQRIASVLDGEFCASCDSPIHCRCARASIGTANCCSRCGARVNHDTGDEASLHDRGVDSDRVTATLDFFFSYQGRASRECYIGRRMLNFTLFAGLCIGVQSTLEAFLTRMVDDEALTGFELSVTATRAQEIAGEVSVVMTLQPTFSIDFIKVTMNLQ